MNIPQLNAAEITPWFNKEELIQECVLQVQKDIGGLGIELHYSGNSETAYDELFSQLQPQIEQILSKSSVLMQLLYKIDVSESAVQKVSEADELFSASLTRLILWRELQKVVTRFLLKQQNL